MAGSDPQALWDAVDRYFNTALIPRDPALDAALERSRAAGLPAIAVAENQGRLLNLLATLIGAWRILEVGTLGGYSAIWLARALPADGRLVSLEIDPTHTEVARANLAAAGLSDRPRFGSAARSTSCRRCKARRPSTSPSSTRTSRPIPTTSPSP